MRGAYVKRRRSQGAIQVTDRWRAGPTRGGPYRIVAAGAAPAGDDLDARKTVPRGSDRAAGPCCKGPPYL